LRSGFRELVEAAGSGDPDAVKTAWEGLQTIQTVYGPGKMGGQASYGINHNVSYATPFSELVNGKVQFIGFREVPLP